MVKYRPLHGARSSMAERHTVDVDVVGSKPIRHPEYRRDGQLPVPTIFNYLYFLTVYLNLQNHT